MFYETMESVLPGLKIVIEGTNGETQTILPLESFIGDTPLVSAESVTQ
jgi:membrane protease subunit HflK